MKKGTGRSTKTAKTKKPTKARAGASIVKKIGMFKIPTPLLNKLSAKAANDKAFKGSNANRYAIHVLKEFVAND